MAEGQSSRLRVLIANEKRERLELLARVVWLASERAFQVVNVDATIMLEKPKLRDHIAARTNQATRDMIEVRTTLDPGPRR